MRYWTCGSGLIELQMRLTDALDSSHMGRCDEDVETASKLPYIREQLIKLNPANVRRELREYGAWDAGELADHETNLQRVVWLAACVIREEAYQRHPRLMGRY